MKIVLTSTGTKTEPIKKYILDLLGESKNVRLLLISTAANVVDDKGFAIREKNRLYGFGFNVTEFDLEGKDVKEVGKAINDNDVVFVTGGHPFYLMKQMKKSGFSDVVKEKLANKVYIGASAGSYVACPSIAMGSWKRERDTYGLDDLSGLSLVDFLFFAHHEEKYTKLLDEKRLEMDVDIYGVTDSQAISVDDGEITFVNF